VKPFSYERAATAAEAVAAAKANPLARFIAGGTNLLDLMKLGIETPAHLIDINRVGLDTIEATAEGGLRIGALVRNADLSADLRIRRDYSVLARALLSGASGQLRNKATTAGNLMQRTRCPYFYNTDMACNKRQPGSGCSAIGGDSHNLAVLGVSDACIATHPSDMCVALRALDATVDVMGESGDRSIPMAEFHRLPGDTPEIETALLPGELIVSVTLPKPAGGVQVYRKVRERASYAFANVSVALVATEGGRIERAAFGGLSHRPWRVEAAEGGHHVGHVMDAVLDGARPQPDNAYKLDLARRTLAAALSEVSR
jgi:xanthine dehydrogenase YagS FAD-binding subunit